MCSSDLLDSDVCSSDLVFYIENIKVEAFLVPGHTWGHLVYLIDDAYLGCPCRCIRGSDDRRSVHNAFKLRVSLRDHGVFRTGTGIYIV